jgi:very-short-patch-repair endonuclease
MQIEDPIDRDRVVRVFKYLRDLHKLGAVSRTNEGNQVLFLASLPEQNKYIECNVWKENWAEDENDREWVKLKKPPQNPSFPVFPEASALDGKLASASPATQQVLKAFNNFTEAPAESAVIPFQWPGILADLAAHAENDPSIPVQSFKQYLSSRLQPYLEDLSRLIAARWAYQQVYALYHDFRKQPEELELVLGVGLLTWAPSEGIRIARHLIVLPTEIQFNSRTGALVIDTINPARKPNVETDMLDPTDLGADKIAEVEAELAGFGSTSRDISRLHTVLPRFANSIGGKGTGAYMGEVRGRYESPATKVPVVTFSPALVLRKRTSRAFQGFVQKVLENFDQKITGTTHLFAKLCEVGAHDTQRQDAPERPEALSADDQTVFFPLACNDEQIEIVHRSRTSAGVLTFGPPGTGKSHTISNLICHNLAEGKRILITAQSPRALQVLHGLLPEDIQPLCIQVLGQGSAEQIVLERCVARIIDKDTNWRDTVQDNRIAARRRELHERRSRLAELINHERAIREKESDQLTVSARYSGSMAAIAAAVNSDSELFSWFTDLVSSPEPRVSDFEGIASAIDLLQRHSTEREFSIIDLATLIQKSADAVNLMGAWHKSLALISNVGSDQAQKLARRLGPLKANELKQLDRDLAQACEMVRHFQSQNVMVAGKPIVDIAVSDTGGLWLQYCDSLADKLQGLEANVVGAIEGNGSGIGLKSLCEELKHIQSLVSHFEAGASLSIFSSKPQPVKDAVKFLKVQRPAILKAGLEDLKAAAQRLVPVETLQQCIDLFGLKIPEAATDLALQTKLYLQELNKVQDCVCLCRLIAKICPALNDSCGTPVNWKETADIVCCQKAARLRFAEIMKADVGQRLTAISQAFESASAQYSAYKPLSEIVSAIRARNIDAFTKLRNRLEQDSALFVQVRAAELRIAALREPYPALHEALVTDIKNAAWQERILQLAEACQWQFARTRIVEYLEAQKTTSLTKEFNSCEKRIGEILSELASLLAWKACIKRMGDRERANLIEWVEAMKRARMKYSKFILRYRAEAQAKMEACRSVVPAWIMPLHRVFETVPPEPGAFDIIIVDEASQCGQDASLLLLLGKQLIVVGDDQQISPTVVGTEGDQIHSLMDTHLKDFEHKTTFYPDKSLFDHCKVLFSKPVSLREHFRCMPEIIEFSNNLCYSANRLIPLRSYPTDRLEPLAPVFVENGYAQGKSESITNRNETAAIVAKIKECLQDRRYKDKTFGVIALQGQAQAALITKLLLEEINPAEIEKRRLICGSPYSFQGDQRNIMFLSMVVSLGDDRRKPAAFTKDLHKKRFNVAASRGQDQVFLFHSIRIEDLKPGCFRRMLLEHYYSKPLTGPVGGCENLQELIKLAASADRKVERPPGKFDSWFEVDVFLHLSGKGYRVVEQFPINEYRIDLVVEGQKHKLAVECDGDYWHGPEQWEYDRKRQRMLERSGWRFFRLLESEYRWDQEATFERLCATLEDHGVLPVYSWSKPEPEPEPEPASIVIEETDDDEPEEEGRESPESLAPSEPPRPVVTAQPRTGGNGGTRTRREASPAGPSPNNTAKPRQECETIVRQFVTDGDVLVIKRHIYLTLHGEVTGSLPASKLSEKLQAKFPQITEFQAKFDQAVSIMRERKLIFEDGSGYVFLR